MIELFLILRWTCVKSHEIRSGGFEYLYGSGFPEKAVKIDAICFDRILMRFLSIFEKFDLTKKQ